MPEIINKTSCLRCYYASDIAGAVVTCHRYPSAQRVARSYWCGEFLDQQEQIEKDMKGKGKSK